MVPWDGEDITGKNVVINSTLIIDGQMKIVNSTVIMEGGGMVLNSSGSLTVVNSVLTSGAPDHGFFLDLRGQVIMDNVTLDGCIDEENSYFGLYLEGTSMHGSGLIMKGSGMIRLEGGGLFLERSAINGIMSYGGNMTIKDSLVDQFGVNHYGEGQIDIQDVKISSSIPFTQTAGLSLVDGPGVSIDGLVVNGSFNAGLFVQSGSLSVEDALIDLPEGLFGLSASASTIGELTNISIKGPMTGVELVDCTMEGDLTSSMLDTSFLGINVQGMEPFSIKETTIMGASYGISSSAPLWVKNSTFIDNEVGILIEDGPIMVITGCRFENFGQWAVEDETWTDRYYMDNEFYPSNESKGIIAWWGWQDIEVTGPGGIPVSGAELVLVSSFGSRSIVRGTEAGVIWGYSGLDGRKVDVNYTIEARWGTATIEMDLVPREGRTIQILLPLTDIYLSNIEYRNDRAVVTLMSNGSSAREVTVEIFIDGKSWNHETVEIASDDIRTVTIALPELDPGSHTIEAKASSNYEYSGMDGYLLMNNAKSTEVIIDREKDDGKVNLVIAGSALSIIAIMIGIVLLRKED